MRAAVESSGLAASRVDKRANVRVGTTFELIAGKKSLPPTARMLQRFAGVLGVDSAWLVHGEGPMCQGANLEVPPLAPDMLNARA